MKLIPVITGMALLAGATAVQAQERGLSRRSFPFFDNQVTVEVVADMPGQLQVIRGEPGRIDVAARVPGGIPAFALGGRGGDRLRLSALGGERANFVVVIPEDASVRVKLPDRNSHQVGALRRSGTYSWGGVDAAADAAEPIALTAPLTSTLAYSKPAAPRVLNVARLNAVRALNIRFEGSTFEVAGTQWMSVKSGNPENIELQTGNEQQDITIIVPVGTRSFTLRLAGRTALQVAGSEIRVFCDPVTEQVLGEGRRWFTFTPTAGRMTCR